MAEAIEKRHLPSLKVLVVNEEDKEHPRLKEACCYIAGAGVQIGCV